MKTKLLITYLTGYLVPPVAWNIFVNFSGILTGADFAAVATNPIQGVYALTFMLILFFILKRKLGDAQKAKSIPTFYALSIFAFCVLGPNSGLIGVPNLSGYQILMANLMSVPLIFLFTVPHLVITTQMLDAYISELNGGKATHVVSLRTKMGVSTIYTFFGSSAFVFIFNIAVVKSFDGAVDLGSLVAKNLVVFVVSFLIAALNFFLLIRQITSPIRATVEVLKDLSEGEGDLTKRVTVRSHDEIGEMAMHLNITLDKVRALVIAIKEQSDSISSIGVSLASSMKETAAAINQISSNIQSIKSRTIEQSASVTETHSTMDQISKNIQTLDGHIDRQTSSVSQSSSAVEEMIANIASVTSTLAKNASSVNELLLSSEEGRVNLEEVSNSIREVARESEGLLEISVVIQAIASQTNLLSMNAAIEAAHAGDSGRGFAVVADEIRKLAESSGSQSKTVSVSLKKIKDAMDLITKSTDTVLRQFESINDKIKSVSNHEQGIRSAMDEQTSGSKEILGAIGSLNDVTTQVKSGSTEMLTGSREIIRESGNLEKITKELAEGMNEIAIGAEQISININRINELSRTNAESAKSLIAEVNRFKV